MLKKSNWAEKKTLLRRKTLKTWVNSSELSKMVDGFMVYGVYATFNNISFISWG
jgi:hypothetical protein